MKKRNHSRKNSKKKNSILKDYLRGRTEKWGKLRNLHDNPKTNRRLNYTYLLIETLIVFYLINAVYECPSALRTCGLKHYQPDGETLKWEANNLDCPYVQEYIDKEKAYLKGGYDIDYYNLSGIFKEREVSPQETEIEMYTIEDET